jgi:hypothetical protein
MQNPLACAGRQDLRDLIEFVVALCWRDRFNPDHAIAFADAKIGTFVAVFAACDFISRHQPLSAAKQMRRQIHFPKSRLWLFGELFPKGTVSKWLVRLPKLFQSGLYPGFGLAFGGIEVLSPYGCARCFNVE